MVTYDELTACQRRQLDELLASDPGLAEGLCPLLDGEDGLEAQALFVHYVSQRLAVGLSPRAAIVLALGDAMRTARRWRDEARRGTES